MNLTPEEYCSIFNDLMGRSYQKERKRIQRLEKINGVTLFDYNGALVDLEKKHTWALTDYKKSVLKWLQQEGTKIGRAYVIKQKDRRLWKVVYEDKEALSYFGALEYRKLFKNVMASSIADKLAYTKPLSEAPLVMLKPRQISDFHNKVLHKIICSTGQAMTASNSICFRVNSMYRENNGSYADEIHLFFSQNPLISPTSCEEKSLYARNKPFYLIHIEDWTNLSDEGLPTEYYTPSLNKYAVTKWMQNLCNCKVSKGETFSCLQVASAWDVLSLYQLRREDTSEVFKECCHLRQRLPLGHNRVKCRKCYRQLKVTCSHTERPNKRKLNGNKERSDFKRSKSL